MSGASHVTELSKSPSDGLEPVHVGKEMSGFVVVNNDLQSPRIFDQSLHPLLVQGCVLGLSNKEDIWGLVPLVELLPRDAPEALVVEVLRDRSSRDLL